MGAGTWHLGLGQDPHNLISKVILPSGFGLNFILKELYTMGPEMKQ